MKIVSVVGARPQFIKVAPIYRAAISHKIEHHVINSGQHYDYEMAEAFFQGFDITANLTNLDVGSGTHAVQTASALIKIEEIIQTINPDWMLVYGDTNTTLAAALYAAKANIKVAHIEAGLRSRDNGMPEEVNRIIVDHISTLNFTPTAEGEKNLELEGLQSTCRLVGDVMIDNLHYFASKLDAKKKNTQKRIIATFHRPSNVDDPIRLQNIMNKLCTSEFKVVIPAHPRLRKNLERYGTQFDRSKIELVSPVPYIEMLKMIFEAKGVVTDSGGLQKETYFLGTPTLTVRNSTEWPETLEGDMNRLDFDLDQLDIFTNIERLDKNLSRLTYGDGDAAKKILDILMRF